MAVLTSPCFYFCLLYDKLFDLECLAEARGSVLVKALRYKLEGRVLVKALRYKLEGRVLVKALCYKLEGRVFETQSGE
jgi:hypothetical protein